MHGDRKVFDDFHVSEDERAQGDKASTLFQAAFPVLKSAPLQQRIDHVVVRLAAPAKLRPQDFEVTILKAEMPQACALPNGNLYITTGMLNYLESDAELAAILSHEMAHVIMHDAQEGQAFAENVIRKADRIDAQNYENKTIAGDFAITTYFGMRREQEMQADTLGFTLLRQAGYECSAFANVLERLIATENAYGLDSDKTHIYDDHPATQARLRKSTELLAEYTRACGEVVTPAAEPKDSIKVLLQQASH